MSKLTCCHLEKDGKGEILFTLKFHLLVLSLNLFSYCPLAPLLFLFFFFHLYLFIQLA